MASGTLLLWLLLVPGVDAYSPVSPEEIAPLHTANAKSRCLSMLTLKNRAISAN